MKKFSRRDFLKLVVTTPTALTLSGVLPRSVRSKALGSLADSTMHNVILIVFDSMSATNLSLYGYPRKTTPNFERFAKRATVYHAHYASASFTVPGTSSILTGMYPWSHRAINLSGLITRNLLERNIFNLLGNEFWRLGFSQNVWANTLLSQFQNHIDEHLSVGTFSLVSLTVGEKFRKDAVNSHRAFDELLFGQKRGPGSLVFGLAHRLYFEKRESTLGDKNYPWNTPVVAASPIYYRLDDVLAGIAGKVLTLPSPFAAYIHIWSPHWPYRPRKEFLRMFRDNWQSPEKPVHFLSKGILSYAQLEKQRRRYDEYVANVDADFGILLDAFERSGILEKSYVIITSDHGEVFERGEKGHITALLFDPVVRVPLIISAPGQAHRNDVFTPTNNVDLLPTLLSLAGREIPDSLEGEVLPGLGGRNDPDRTVFMMDAKDNSAFSPMIRATFAMRKGKNKLVYYKGYGIDTFELYDLENDPQELNDLLSTQPAMARDMKEILLKKIEASDHPQR